MDKIQFLFRSYSSGHYHIICFWGSQCELQKIHNRNRILKHRLPFWLFLAKALTGIVILKQSHLVRRVNSHLGSKVKTLLLPQAGNTTKHTCICLKWLPYLYKQAHGSSSTPPTRPFTYLLTKLGTCTPPTKIHLLHVLTQTTRTWPFTLYELGKNMNMPLEKQPVREVHELLHI